MAIPDIITNMPRVEAKIRPSGIRARDFLLFILCLLLGGLIVLHPLAALVFSLVVAAFAFCWWAIAYVHSVDLEAWQVLLLIALTGYIVLNYGFENLAVHVGGFPIIISYGLMYASLALALFSYRHVIIPALKEPAWLCVLALIVLTLFHLVRDIQHYGIWALRDASLSLDGLFILLGLFWAMKRNAVIPLLKWLTVVFLLNLAYCSLFLWQEKISSWSPKSGVFIPVPILGNYWDSVEFLLLGALFYLFLARYVVGWPRWILLVLAAVQIFGLAILQARGAYLAFAVAVVVFALLGEAKKAGKLLLMLVPAIAVILLITTLGIQVKGRIGLVKVHFFEEHIRSISGAQGTPGSNIEDRVQWLDQAMRHFWTHPIVGVGFGQTLIHYRESNKLHTAVRQPHDSNISILARLGVIGFAIWLIFNLFVVGRFIHGLWQRRYYNRILSDFIIWLFLFYLVFLIDIGTEPGLEFPSSAISFFFFVGLAIGLIRWHVPRKYSPEREAVGHSGETRNYENITCS
jgi:O-antigen ligase